MPLFVVSTRFFHKSAFPRFLSCVSIFLYPGCEQSIHNSRFPFFSILEEKQDKIHLAPASTLVAHVQLKSNRFLSLSQQTCKRCSIRRAFLVGHGEVEIDCGSTTESHRPCLLENVITPRKSIEPCRETSLACRLSYNGSHGTVRGGGDNPSARTRSTTTRNA